jgi:arylsulfatase A-like enzyme
MTLDRYFNYEINENGVLVRYGTDASSYSTDVLARKGEDFIRRQVATSKPFFLLITPKAPHSSGGKEEISPAIPAPRHDGTLPHLTHPKRSFNEANVADKPGFVQALPRLDATGVAEATAMFRKGRESLLAVDDMIEKVVQTLLETRKLNNTVIIFTSDNGFLYGEHRIFGKRVLYEESIRVPLVMRGPGIPPAQVRTAMVNNLDVVATIVRLARAEPGIVLDGRNLMPLIENSEFAWRGALLVQGSNPDPSPDIPIVGRFFAVRTANFIYAQHKAEPGYPFGIEKELYDLSLDPAQRFNRADDPNYRDVVLNLHELLKTLKSCSGPSCWVRRNPEPARRAAGSSDRVQPPIMQQQR